MVVVIIVILIAILLPALNKSREIDGQRIGELLRPGGDLDITQLDTLRAFVTRNYTGISRGFVQDVLRYSARASGEVPMGSWSMGITGPVVIHAVPAVPPQEEHSWNGIIATMLPDLPIFFGATLDRTERTGAYAVTTVWSETERTAQVRVGANYWMSLWVNGKRVYDLNCAHGAPKLAQSTVSVKLNKRNNVFTVKILSGGKGFGFWVDVARNDESPEQENQTMPASFYVPLARKFDPHEFFYW